MKLRETMHDVPRRAGWLLEQEVRCSRQTLWKMLRDDAFWGEAWGKCTINFAAGELFIDDTKAIMPESVGLFAQVTPLHGFDLYWYLGRSSKPLPRELSSENSLHLRLSIQKLAASVLMVSVQIVSINEYPPRGKWAGASKRQWAGFLETLRDKAERYTTV